MPSLAFCLQYDVTAMRRVRSESKTWVYQFCLKRRPGQAELQSEVTAERRRACFLTPVCVPAELCLPVASLLASCMRLKLAILLL
jgi:hypothetical protein